VSTAAIAGTGLIGSSIGLALSRSGWVVLGWDPSVDAAAAARDAGAVADLVGSFDELVSAAADVIVLAGPPAATVAALEGLATPSLVMDVAGVKRPIVAAAGDIRFVGTHPMAGREISGPAAATAGLFRGATWVVTTDGAAASDLLAVEDLIRSLGATPVRMTAAAHDKAVARISHLPQLVAAAMLLNAAGTDEAMSLAAGSFRDITRVAASDPSLWVGLLAMNRDEVVAATTELTDVLGAVRSAVAADAPGVHDTLHQARLLRATVGTDEVAVRVALVDRPGELACVGRALEHGAVDVRDIQLRHAPHGGGGILTLAVRRGHEEHLVTALEDEGLIVVD
jgi:prephenate dehydrogenase